MSLSRDVIRLVNKKFSFLKLWEAIGEDTWRVPGSARCVFHNDSSKSAKLFEDGLYCWVCRRRFGSYDLLKMMGKSDGEILRTLAKTDLTLEETPEPATLNMEKASELKRAFMTKRLTFDALMIELRKLYGSQEEA